VTNEEMPMQLTCAEDDATLTNLFDSAVAFAEAAIARTPDWTPDALTTALA
jgi:hypothetical protein